MIESLSKGGKSKGLELLIENTNLGYKVPGYDRIDASYYDFIEKQLYMAKIASAVSTIKDPKGTVTTFAASKLPKEIKDQITILARKYKGKNVIVRSDSFKEDSEHSFAGIYDSFVVKNVTKEKLADVIMKVYASLHSEKAQRYRTEHSIKDDKMGVIIQEFIEPDWSGVMYTSNPSYPPDLSIEFCFRGNKVVDATTETFIIDFEKKTKERVFESENYNDPSDKTKERLSDIDRLANIGIELDKKLGPSDIEFLVKNKDIYLVQRRQITDLVQPVDVTIPDYSKEQFIGSTRVTRGQGKITLPVIWSEDMNRVVDRASMFLSIGETDKCEDTYREYFTKIIELNKQYKDGYILITPHFDQTMIERISFFFIEGTKKETTLDDITTNKKAVITTECYSLASHIMTVAREKGISYAGFANAEERIFGDVYTNDVLSIYFKGREAFVYKEKTPIKSMKETHPKASIKIRKKKGRVSFETPDYTYLGSHKSIVNDFEYFLNQSTSDEWKCTTIGDHMGAVFTNSKGKSIYLSIAAQHGSRYFWWLAHDSNIIGFKKPLPKQEFESILKEYVKHFKK